MIVWHVGVPIVSNKNCQDMYDKVMWRIPEVIMCAGYKEGGRDACQVSLHFVLTRL